VSVDHATTPTLDSLRRSRALHEALQRRIRIFAPLLLGVFVLAAFQAHPGPGLAGRSLGVSIGVAGYVVAVIVAVLAFGGAHAPDTARPVVAPQFAVAIVIFASSVALLSLQPTGPGAEGAFLGVIALPVCSRCGSPSLWLPPPSSRWR
jgi:hypothetical protein